MMRLGMFVLMMLCGCALFGAVRSDYWGIVWTNDQEFATAVTNEPGRIRAPVYYAFLDGVDTRNAFFTNGLTYEIGVEHTNLTARFVEYQNLRDRYVRTQNLDLDVGETTQIRRGTYVNDTNFWSSTILDDMENAWPPVAGFSFTKDPCAKIFAPVSSNLINNTWAISPFNTKWLPTFAATSGNSFYNYAYLTASTNNALPVFHPRRYHNYNSYPKGFAGVVPEVLYALDSDFGYLFNTNLAVRLLYDYDNDYGTAYAPPIPSFDESFERTFDVTNIVAATNISARHLFNQQQQAERGLSCFDRVINIAGKQTVYTNNLEVHGNVRYHGDVSLGTVTLNFFNGGNPSITGSNPTMTRVSDGEWGLDTNNTHVTIYNDYYEASAPRFRLGTPTLSSSALITTVGAAGDGWVSISNANVQACLNAMLNAAGVDVDTCMVDSYLDSMPNACLRFTHPTLGTYEPISVSLGYTNGNYKTSGSLSVSYAYTAQTTGGPLLPLDLHLWPSSERFKDADDAYTFYTFYSFAEANATYRWNDDIWIYDNGLHDFGYACNITKSNRRVGIAEGLAQAVIDIESFAGDDFSMCMTNPVVYSQMSESCLNVVRSNYNADREGKLTLSTDIQCMECKTILYYHEGPGSSFVCVEFYPSPLQINGFNLFHRSEVSISVQTSTSGVSRRSKARAIDGHIQQVIDARLEFPQCTTCTNKVENR